MWDGFNKRKFPRLALRCEVSILSDKTGRPLVTLTENLGIGGVCIILDDPLERFSKCRLRLELDDKLNIECDGRVVWAVPTQGTKPNTKQYDTGIEFTGLDAEVSDRIRQYLEAELKKSPSLIVK